jgi:hypothetical protein
MIASEEPFISLFFLLRGRENCIAFRKNDLRVAVIAGLAIAQSRKKENVSASQQLEDDP